MLAKRLIKSNDAGGGGACTNTVDLYNPFPDGGGVALYQLNGDATDVSGNYDGTASNVTYSTGVFGQAGVFNGTSSKIVVNDPVITTGDFSVSLWVKVNSAKSYSEGIISNNNETNNTGFAFVRNYVTQKFNFFTGNGVGSVYAISNDTVSLNTWYHIVLNYSGTTLTLYVNGAAQTTTGTATLANSNLDLILGTYSHIQTRFLDGSIDQVRVFSRALRPYEVEALYTEEYCTPTIVPSEHFNTVTYTGNGSTQSITGVDFQPDFTWIKDRDTTGESHRLNDSVRGVGKPLYSNGNFAEGSEGTTGLTAFNINGFSIGNATAYNNSGKNYVAWNFKAGGAAVTNTDGTITSQVSANTEAGFSVVSYTGTGTTTGTVGHGLGDTPSVFIVKERTATSASGGVWGVYFVPENLIAFLNLTNAAGDATVGGNNGGFASNQTTDTTLQFITGSISNNNWNNNGSQYIIYCFAEVEGFSSFGSYVGTGASGNTVVTGFEPAFVMIKCTSEIMNWAIFDNKRDTTNPNEAILYPNLSLAETNSAGSGINFLSNGFELDTTSGGWINNSGASFIYMAFAADPTTVEPTLEDSFNTVVYSGDGTTNHPITGVGFQPDLLWIKNRFSVVDHILFDSVRGVVGELRSNTTDAEGPVDIISFDSDGFTLDATGNASGTNNHVAWCWKGAELPAINSNGSIPSVVSANPAAGFSIVSYTNSTSGTVNQNYTIGHGLASAPDLIITKVRNVDGFRWTTYNSFNGSGQYMALNETRASTTYAIAFPVAPSSNVFTLDEAWPHRANDSAIAYCFHSVAGFSKFGSYDGGTITSSNIVNLGFRPAFVMLKTTQTVNDWIIYDNKRDTTDPLQHILYPATSGVEQVSTNDDYNLYTTPNGFYFNNTNGFINRSASDVIYMAFANQF